MPRSRRAGCPARASPCKGLRPSGRPERGGGFSRSRNRRGVFSDLKAGDTSVGPLALGQLAFEVLMERRRPGRPRPGVRKNVERREAKRTRTDAQDG